jgi:protein involved in polysaccharide export with SLBB domain
MLKVLKSSLRLLLISTLLISFSPEINAQQLNINQIDFSSINVDDLTDAQVKQFIGRAKATGMSIPEMEAEAISRGMPYDEVLKLRERISALEMGEDKTVGQGDVDERKASFSTDTKVQTQAQLDDVDIFGSNLFKRKDLTFEPSLNIPTPPDYQLGSGDVLNIEVWGASQSSFKLKISPEGQIFVPSLGPIQVSGLTVERATSLIINKLSTIYSGLKGASPNTFAQVTLGNIRSIKVTIAGEAFMPGTYTLPAFATVFNALYFAGGPGGNGTYREVKVIRSGNTIANIDLYSFLLKAESSQNIRLQDEDMIFIGPYKNRVMLSGEVIRPAIYELRENETLSDLISYAGGYTSSAFHKSLVVNRKTESERRLLNVDSDLFSSFLMKNGDVLKVGKILERYENRVTIRGAVFREGEYALKEGMTLTDLINKAEGLREDAFTSRASIYRLRENLEVEVIDVDLKAILENPAMDLQLKREDLLLISSILELKQERTVNIVGEVQKPGSFPYADNISLGELIRKAGGLKHSASLAMVEVARRVQNRAATESSETISEVFNFPIDENLSVNDEGSSFRLKPFDIVFVRTSPGYKKQELAKAEGEFTFPGSYAIAQKGERISDLVARAGGLTPDAYLPGATLLRKIDDTQREQAERIKELEGDNLEIDANIDEQMNNSHQPIGINLEKILKNPKSNEDLLLVEGDILRVPQQLQTVRLSGELLNPVTTRYLRNVTLRRYVAHAGGFTDNARKSKVFVVYANGSVNKTRNFIFFRVYPKIEPGAEIVVPTKPERDGVSLQETLAISSSLSSIALVTISIINQLAK